MSKSNQEIWDSVNSDGISDWDTWESWARSKFADFAEAVREDQRKVDADAAKTALARFAFKDGYAVCTTVVDAILTAGKEPELKPGMLARSITGNATPFLWSDGMSNPQDFRPLTKAEIQEYMDKAPDA